MPALSVGDIAHRSRIPAVISVSCHQSSLFTFDTNVSDTTFPQKISSSAFCLNTGAQLSDVTA